MKRITQNQQALGSEVTLTLVANANQHDIEEIFRSLWLLVFTFEKQFSRFLPASELSRFNKAAGRKVSVTAEFGAVLRAAREWAEKTDGLFNPFILPSLQRVGYDHSFAKGYEHDQQDDFSRRNVGHYSTIEVGDDWARIPHGTALDFGGIGKGYLADALGQRIPKQVTGYCLSVGGDIVCSGTDEQGKPWIVDVATNDEQLLGRIHQTASTLSVASSGVTKRQGVKDGKSWHHIIDPRSGSSAITDVLQMSVVADSVTAADVLAKCALIYGSQDAFSFLKSHGATAGVMQHTTKSGMPKVTYFGTIDSSDKASEVK